MEKTVRSILYFLLLVLGPGAWACQDEAAAKDLSGTASTSLKCKMKKCKAGRAAKSVKGDTSTRIQNQQDTLVAKLEVPKDENYQVADQELGLLPLEELNGTDFDAYVSNKSNFLPKHSAQ